MKKYISMFLSALLMLVMLMSASGCTMTVGCYGYGCDHPYDYGFNAKRFSESGTRQPDGYYRPIIWP